MAAVLVVDDERSIRVTLRTFLREAGHDAAMAEDYETAVAMLEQSDVDVVVSDIVLPRHTGVELLQRIKVISPQIQVIMMTGEPAVETAAEAVRLGAFDYLSKPVTKDAILRCVASAARVKALADEKERLGEENRRYQRELQRLVQERTEALKETQAQLWQAQKMEAVGQLAGGVAHDFNNLLMVMQACAAFLAEELDSPDAARADLDELNAAIKRAAGLTRQLLLFSRKQSPRPEVVDLNDVIENLRKMLGRLIGEKVTISLNLDRDLPPARVDPAHFEQVVVNLAVNARDAMPDGGSLTIGTDATELGEADKARLVEVEGFAPGQYVVLRIEDTGVGMPPETVARIFDPFFSTKQPGQGTGLGLSTVFGIVKQHHGYIAVHSVPRQGTRFEIFLPACVEEEPDQAEMHEAPAEYVPRGNETILLVEDAVEARQALTRYAEELGYRVLEASCAEEACQVAAQCKGEVDLLMTDVVMPGADGPTLARLLLSRYPDLAVVFMSGYDDDVTAVTEELLPNARMLHKPFTMEEMGITLRNALK